MSHCHSHDCHSGASSVCQTLDELDFERGLWFAAQYGELERVRKLVFQGTCVDVRDHAGYTALHYAARAGHLDVCRFLLAHGADINAVTKAGRATALHRAASVGEPSHAHMLYAHSMFTFHFKATTRWSSFSLTTMQICHCVM